METLVTRELKFYYERLRSLYEKKISKEMRSELENLIARSCLGPFLMLDQITADEYPKLRERAHKMDMTLPELLRQIGLIRTIKIMYIGEESGTRAEQGGSAESVAMDCPDLVKEYLVLRQAIDKGNFDILFPEDWDNDPMHLLFLHRIFADYPEKLEGNGRFWTTFFAGEPKYEFFARIYSNLLLDTTTHFPKKDGQTCKYMSSPKMKKVGKVLARAKRA